MADYVRARPGVIRRQRERERERKRPGETKLALRQLAVMVEAEKANDGWVYACVSRFTFLDRQH